MVGDGGGRLPIAASIVLLGLLLAGCASHPYVGSFGGVGGAAGDGLGTYRVGGPYQIKGVWYYPAVDYNYDKTGVASWYGEYFQGRSTANGEIFDLNQLTAANTTLPMPSIVQVTNLQNGRSLRLRVNDRGPFVGGRLIDVSRRAAQLLGFETHGTAPVEVRILREESIEVAEEAMRNSGQVLVADAGAAERTAGMAPASAAYPAAAPPPRIRVETASRPPARTATPPPTIRSSPPAAQVAMAPPARTSDASSPSAGAYAALSQFALIAPAEAAPLPHAPAPGRERKAVVGSIRTPEMPFSGSRTAMVASRSAGRIYIQAGAFSMRDNARRVQSRIANLGSVRVLTAAINGVEVYRVRLGPVASRAQADRLLQTVVSSGYAGARIVTD